MLKLNGLSDLIFFQKNVDIEAVACVHNLQYRFSTGSSFRMRGPQVESLVSLGWCIRRGTWEEGDGDADYLPAISLCAETIPLSPKFGLRTNISQKVKSEKLISRQNSSDIEKHLPVSIGSSRIFAVLGLLEV